jgi:hypothetical protein
MMLVWESSNSKWGIWAVVDKTLPSLLAIIPTPNLKPVVHIQLPCKLKF